MYFIFEERMLYSLFMSNIIHTRILFPITNTADAGAFLITDTRASFLPFFAAAPKACHKQCKHSVHCFKQCCFTPVQRFVPFSLLYLVQHGTFKPPI